MSRVGGIGPAGRADLTAVLGRSRSFIRPEDVADVLGLDQVSAAKRLARWAAAGWLRRVRRGLYIAVPVDAPDPASWSADPLVLAAEVWAQCYFTGWTAAGQWSLTDQVFRVTVVRTPTRVRAARVTLLDNEYLIGAVPESAMGWGLRPQWRGTSRLLFADPARTVIESLDAPAIGGGIRHVAEILSTYLDEHDPNLLIDYGQRLGNGTVFKRLGYLTEALQLDLPNLVAACASRVPSGISALDPTGPTDGEVAGRWNLRINATITPGERS